MHDKFFLSYKTVTHSASDKERKATTSRDVANMKVMEKQIPQLPLQGKIMEQGRQDPAEPIKKFKHLLNSEFQENQTPSLQKNI